MARVLGGSVDGAGWGGIGVVGYGGIPPSCARRAIPVLGVGSAGLHVLENIGVGENQKKLLGNHEKNPWKKTCQEKKNNKNQGGRAEGP